MEGRLKSLKDFATEIKPVEKPIKKTKKVVVLGKSEKKLETKKKK